MIASSSRIALVGFLLSIQSNVALSFCTPGLRNPALAHDGGRPQQRHNNDRTAIPRNVVKDPDGVLVVDSRATIEETAVGEFGMDTVFDPLAAQTSQLSAAATIQPLSTSPLNKISTISFGEKSISSTTTTKGNAEYRRGLATIGFITLLFSSNSPALHAAFSESAPPVLLLNAAVSIVALVGLLFGGPLLEATTPLPTSLLQNQLKQLQDDGTNALADEAATTTMLQLTQETKAGLELGLWKFLGTTANLYGLSLTTASHGAFLIQLTTLIVPVVQGVMGVPIPLRVQYSVALALAGVFIFTQDASGSADLVGGGSTSSVAIGDALCVLAAGFYATYDLRLFQWGKLVKPRDLITNKIATQALFSILLLLAAGREETMQFLASNSFGLASFSNSNDHSMLLLVMVTLWSGVAVNALAPFLQVGGQQAIGPTRAQTLYASQPLWAAILSCIFLGETVGMQGLFGGSAFLAALFLAATAEAPDPDCGAENCEV